MIVLYLGLLIGGVALLSLSYIAQFRIAHLLRQRYPQHWQVIVEADRGKVSAWHNWIRMQHVLRSPALPALGDTTIDLWQRVWRYTPWLGWLCWLAALAMRLLLR